MPRPKDNLHELAQRRRIVTAAREQLVHHGTGGLSMVAIANRAGMSAGHLYYYFPSRSLLLQALLETELDSMLGPISHATCARQAWTLVLDALDLGKPKVETRGTLSSWAVLGLLHSISADDPALKVAIGRFFMRLTQILNEKAPSAMEQPDRAAWGVMVGAMAVGLSLMSASGLHILEDFSRTAMMAQVLDGAGSSGREG